MKTQPDQKNKKTQNSFRIVILAFLSIGLLTGCQEVQQTLSIGDLASTYNDKMWQLMWWAVGLSIIIFFGVSGLLFYTVARFREDKHNEEPQQFHGNDKLEMFLVGLPVLIVVFLSVYSVKTMVETRTLHQNEGPTIVAYAKQFWWNFSYPDVESDAGGVVTIGNEMVMPAKSNVTTILQSGDVVHEFWAPNIGSQRQAIPGSEKVWSIHTERPAAYQGNCNYLCGASHANMRYKVIALNQEDYDAFISAAKAYKAPTPEPGSREENGYNLFMNGKEGALSCAACHRIQGTPANSPAGPDLSFFGSRRTLGAGMWEAPNGWNDAKANEHLINWITNSPKVKPGSLMPPYDGSSYRIKGKETAGNKLTAEEIADIAAYLKTLKLPEEGDYWQKINHFNEPSFIIGGSK